MGLFLYFVLQLSLKTEPEKEIWLDNFIIRVLFFPFLCEIIFFFKNIVFKVPALLKLHFLHIYSNLLWHFDKSFYLVLLLRSLIAFATITEKNNFKSCFTCEIHSLLNIYRVILIKNKPFISSRNFTEKIKLNFHSSMKQNQFQDFFCKLN